MILLQQFYPKKRNPFSMYRLKHSESVDEVNEVDTRSLASGVLRRIDLPLKKANAIQDNPPVKKEQIAVFFLP